MSTSVYEMNAHEYKTLWYAAAADIEKMQQLIAADEALLRQALEALDPPGQLRFGGTGRLKAAAIAAIKERLK